MVRTGDDTKGRRLTGPREQRMIIEKYGVNYDPSMLCCDEPENHN